MISKQVSLPNLKAKKLWNLLKSYDDIDVVIAENDNMAFGAIDAIKAAGKDPGKIL